MTSGIECSVSKMMAASGNRVTEALASEYVVDLPAEDVGPIEHRVRFRCELRVHR